MKNSIFSEVIIALKEYYLWTTLGWYDVLARYRRSTLGPFWITISMGITIAAMGPLYGALFGNDLEDFVPHLALGMIFWGLISSVINESGNAYADSAHYLKQVKISPVVFILRVLYRQIIILGHNFLIYPLIMLILWKGLNWNVLWIIPAFLLVLINLFWMGLVISIFCTRYRDMGPVINSVMTLLFFVTPIIWKIEQLPAERAHLAYWNPFTFFMDLLRSPILGNSPAPQDWLICGVMAAAGLAVALLLFKYTRRRITYWL